MKPIILLFLGAVALQAQQPQPQKPEERPLAQITFRVVTDGGEPIGNVEVALATFHHWQPGEGFGKDVSEVFTGITNEKGLVTISGKSLRGDFNYNPRQKDGILSRWGRRIPVQRGEEWPVAAVESDHRCRAQAHH